MSNDYGDAMEEVILVKKAQQGDRRAFCDLYSLYKEPFYRYALYRLGHPEDAEDAVSECVLQLWHRLPTLREPAAFRTFAYRILSGCCSRLIRSGRLRTVFYPRAAPGSSARRSTGADRTMQTMLRLRAGLR